MSRYESPGALPDAAQKVFDFIEANGLTPPKHGADTQAPIVTVSRDEVTVRAQGDSIVGIEFHETPRQDISDVLCEAINEALAEANRQVLAEVEGMPSAEEVRANVAQMQREVLDAYRIDIDRIMAPIRDLKFTQP